MRENMGNRPRKFRGNAGMSATVAEVVSDFLRREYQPMRNAAKLIARAARATPRTAEAWLDGHQAPQAEHLINLMTNDKLAEEILKLVEERKACGEASASLSGGSDLALTPTGSPRFGSAR